MFMIYIYDKSKKKMKNQFMYDDDYLMNIK